MGCQNFRHGTVVTPASLAMYSGSLLLHSGHIFLGRIRSSRRIFVPLSQFTCCGNKYRVCKGKGTGQRVQAHIV